MKAKALKLLSLFMIVFSMGSCSNEATNNDGTENGVVFRTMEENSLIEILESMQALADEHRQVVTFGLEYVDGIYKIEENSINIAENDDVSKFVIGAMTYTLNLNSDPEPGTAIINCYIGENVFQTLCPPGSSQFMCVGSAVMHCLQADGCIEACRVPVVAVTPTPVPSS